MFVATILDKDLETEADGREDEPEEISRGSKMKKKKRSKKLHHNMESVPFRVGDLVVRVELVSVHTRDSDSSHIATCCSGH